MEAPTIMLDSGAFSAWSQKTTVDLDDYIRFIKENIEWIDYYVNLDVIPGEFGRIPSQAEVEASAQASWSNFLYMQEFSLDPIPVFHMGEDFKWLEKMVQHGCKYVGISPANDRTTNEKILWLDRVFERIVDEDRRPIIHTHAFGVTAVRLMRRYPWFSVDSSSWAVGAGLGTTYIPRFSHSGEALFDQSPVAVTFSDRKKGDLGSTNYWQMPRLVQDRIRAYIESYGETIEGMASDYRPRTRMNVRFFEAVVQEINRTGLGDRFLSKKFGFFG